MRRIAALLLLVTLTACYQVADETVPAAASVRVDGVKDGRYRRPDGVEVAIRWDAALRQYHVAAMGTGGSGGTARAMRLAPGVYLVQYQDAARLTLLAVPQGDDMVLLAPAKAAEQRLIKAYGLSLRPGPINALTGPPAAMAGFFKDLAASGDLAEEGRLSFIP